MLRVRSYMQPAAPASCMSHYTANAAAYCCGASVHEKDVLMPADPSFRTCSRSSGPRSQTCTCTSARRRPRRAASHGSWRRLAWCVLPLEARLLG